MWTQTSKIWLIHKHLKIVFLFFPFYRSVCINTISFCNDLDPLCPKIKLGISCCFFNPKVIPFLAAFKRVWVGKLYFRNSTSILYKYSMKNIMNHLKYKSSSCTCVAVVAFLSLAKHIKKNFKQKLPNYRHH